MMLCSGGKGGRGDVSVAVYMVWAIEAGMGRGLHISQTSSSRWIIAVVVPDSLTKRLGGPLSSGFGRSEHGEVQNLQQQETPFSSSQPDSPLTSVIGSVQPASFTPQQHDLHHC